MQPGRRNEIAFGLAVLLVPLVLLAAAETLSWRLWPRAVDWARVELALSATPGARPYLMRPGASYGPFRINALGLRGPELADPKDPGTIRIAVLGDSMTFGDELAEQETVGARIADAARAALPKCRFDYASFAGPSYTLHFLAAEWPRLRDRLRPDVTIVLTGSAFEALASPRGGRPPPSDRVEELMRDHLRAMWLVDAIRRRVSLFPRFDPGSAADRDLDRRFEERLEAMGGALAALAPEGAVIVVGHRGQVRSTGDAAARERATRRLRQNFNLRSPVAAAGFVERTLAAMRAVAWGRGWVFADPFLEMTEDRFFLADLHLSPEGTEELARRLVPALVSVLPGCAARQGGAP